MTIIVKYFGEIAECTGKSSEQVDLNQVGNMVADFRQYLLTQYTKISHLTYQISVNKKLASDGRLRPGDEVAVLPPFAGG